MSKTVYEEIIEIMGKKVPQNIVDQINEQDSKYFSLVVDSSPDVEHKFYSNS